MNLWNRWMKFRSPMLAACGLWLAAFLSSCQQPLPAPGPTMLLAPAEDAVLRNGNVTLFWVQPVGVSGYQLQLARDAKFAKLLRDDTVFPEAPADTHRLDLVLPDGSYWWRVRTVSPDQVWSDWSDGRRFRVEQFRIVACAKTQGYPHDLALDGNLAYVADGQAGLAVFDLSNPESPRLVGTKMDSMNVAWGVAAQAHRAYVSYGYKELYIVDATRPESLRVLGEVEYYQPGFGYDIALADSFVFIAADAQFIIMNVADPVNPSQVIQFRYPRCCRGVAVAGRDIYLACGQLGVAVWRFNPDSAPPAQTASFDTPANAQAVAARGPWLYVADGRNGLVVADVANPAAPQPRFALALPGYARNVSLADSLLLVSCGAGGLAVVNVARPEQPTLAATVSLPYTMCAQAQDGYIFAGDRDSGLVVIKIEE